MQFSYDTYMNAVFISATQDVVLGDGDAVDAATRGLQIAHTLQAIQIPHLHRGQRQAVIQAFPQILLLLYMHIGPKASSHSSVSSDSPSLIHAQGLFTH